MPNVHEIKKKYWPTLATLANVVSIGVRDYKTKSTGERFFDPTIVIGVTRKLPENQLRWWDVVPKELEGFKTDVEQMGLFEGFELTDRVRPLRPGYSIGHVDITAGTLGCLTIHKGEVVMLSNAHVFTGDPLQPEQEKRMILQPGKQDGGIIPEDIMGKLIKYQQIYPMNFESECPASRGIAGFINMISSFFERQTRMIPSELPKENLVDAAIAEPLFDVDAHIPKIGIPIGTLEGELRMPVQKTGRTTELTKGYVDQIDVTTSVGYGGTNFALFSDQFIVKGAASYFSKSGDSGSVVLDPVNNIIGLLFAGSQTENVTIINRIQNVEKILGIEF